VCDGLAKQRLRTAGADNLPAVAPTDLVGLVPVRHHRLSGPRGNDYSVGLGQGLQPSSEVGRLADDIVLNNFTADDNQPGGNPDSSVKLFGLIQLRHPID